MAQEENPQKANGLLIAAIRKKSPEYVRAAFDLGASADAHSKTGLSALAIATGIKHLKIITLLLDAGADPNDGGKIPALPPLAPTNFDKTRYLPPPAPLVLAFNNNSMDIMALLLEYKANPNTKDLSGMSLLETAVCEEDEAKVELLLTYKADTHTSNKPPFTVFDYAKLTDNIKIIQMLNDYAAGRFIPSANFLKMDAIPDFKTPLPELDVNSLISEFNKDFWSTKPLPEFDPHLFNAEFKKETGHYFNVFRNRYGPS